MVLSLELGPNFGHSAPILSESVYFPYLKIERIWTKMNVLDFWTLIYYGANRELLYHKVSSSFPKMSLIVEATSYSFIRAQSRSLLYQLVLENCFGILQPHYKPDILRY